MKESFLCYLNQGTPFLIMLDAVPIFSEAPADGQVNVKFQDHEIPVQDFFAASRLPQGYAGMRCF